MSAGPTRKGGGGGGGGTVGAVAQNFGMLPMTGDGVDDGSEELLRGDWFMWGLGRIFLCVRKKGRRQYLFSVLYE